jgi:N-acetylneuraminate synthase
MSVKFIADIGSNHNRDLKRAFQLIETAKKIGCWGVKFQLFKADKLYAPGFGDVEELKKRELPPIWIPLLKGKCDQLDIKFGCTPFDLDAVDHLKNSVDFFKISSFDILQHDLIEACAKTKKPIIFSTGLVHPFLKGYNEILSILKLIYKSKNKNVTIMYCISEYPTQIEHCNLNKIEDYYIAFSKNNWISYPIIGYSDHSVQPGVIYKAVELGAKTIEFHLDLHDEQGFEYQYGHCWQPYQMAGVIYNVRVGEEACAVPRQIAKYEQRADPSDGLRPMKEVRNGKNIL